jgi:hypothetical protein
MPLDADIGKQSVIQVAHILQRLALCDALAPPRPQLRKRTGAAAGDDRVWLVDGM